MARPKKAVNEVLLDLPCKVSPATVREVEQLAIRLERSKSFISRKMLLRGLAAYERDGLIDEPTGVPMVKKLPVMPVMDMEPADRRARKKVPAG